MTQNRFRYISYEESKGYESIIVNGSAHEKTVLTLSHWPKSGTPRPLKADTSAGIVLNYLTSSDRETYRRGAEAISANRFSVDGLIALWMMLHSEEALRQQELLLAIATAGDFGVVRDPLPAKISLAIATYADEERSPIKDQLASTSDANTLLYTLLLEKVGDFIEYIDRYRELWIEEYEDLEQSWSMLASGEARIREIPHVDLAIVEAKVPLHPMALFSATERLRIFTILQGPFYDFEYRAESWSQFVSRPVMPRIDLTRFTRFLNTLENYGSWRFEGLSIPTPHLFLRDPDGQLTQSAIDHRVFLDGLVGYFERGAEDKTLQWDPGDIEK